MNNETYKRKLSMLSPAIQAWLGVECSVTTDVVIDSADQLRYIKRQALLLGVRTTLRSIYDTTETTSGKLGRVLKYYFMNPISNTPDSSHSGSEYEVGLTLKFDMHGKDASYTPNMFREFIMWIGKAYPDFVAGISENPNIRAEFKAVI